MPGYEPCCFDVVFGKEFEKAPDTNGTGKETTGDIACGILSSIRAEPSRYSIDINRDTALNTFSTSISMGILIFDTTPYVSLAC